MPLCRPLSRWEEAFKECGFGPTGNATARVPYGRLATISQLPFLGRYHKKTTHRDLGKPRWQTSQVSSIHVDGQSIAYLQAVGS